MLFGQRGGGGGEEGGSLNCFWFYMVLLCSNLLPDLRELTLLSEKQRARAAERRIPGQQTQVYGKRLCRVGVRHLVED